MNNLLEGFIVLYVIGGLCFLGIFIKIMLFRTYRRLICAAEEMGNSVHPLMKTLRLKFETCYELRMGVNNVDIFVDKYVYNYRMLGLHLYTWDNLCNQILVIVAVISVFYGAAAISIGIEKQMVLSTLCGGFFLCGLLILLDHAVNLSTKREVLKINIRDYLENIFKPRLENQIFHEKEQKEYREQYFEESVPQEETAHKDRSNAPILGVTFTKEEERVIEEVLNEYMI